MRALAAVLLSVCWMSVHAALKTTWDVGDYVQDGIIMHYDGIRNVGAGLPHDPQAEQWVDLSPTGGYAVNRACKYGGTGSWTDKSYLASGLACMETVNEVALGSNFTIQIACELDVTSDDRTHPVIFGIGSDDFAIRMDRSFAGQQELTNVHWKVSQDLTGAQHNLDFKWHDGLYINAGANDEYLLFTNGTDWAGCEKTYGTGSPRENGELPASKYFIGGIPIGGPSGERNYCTIGHYYAVRVYSRMLTKDELAWNRAIDEIRFHGATAAPCTNVVVAAAAAGKPDGAEIPGAYVVDGSHTFTAVATSYGGNSFAPLGYTLETWDTEAGDWGEAVYHEGAAYVYDAAVTDVVVRLAWVWEQTSGIRRYDVGDYVQEGLVMHYDGIRNVGAGLPHDSDAVQWKDLSPLQGYAENKACVWGGNGYWVDDAYVVTGMSCMETKNQPALGGEFTIQIACDLDITSDDRTYPCIFGNSDFSLWMNRSYAAQQALTNVFWTTDSYSGNTSGNRPQTEWLVGHYLTAAFDSDYMYLTPDTTWASTLEKWGMRQSRPNPVDLPGMTYYIGGRHVGGGSGGRNYCSIGKFHSVRAYTRKLTDAELAKNRDVDEVRFHGAAPTGSDSVWVVSSRDGLSGNESGAYILDGEYAFTAPETAKFGEKEFILTGSVVESWNPASKLWENPVYESGTSRTLRQADSAVARRLTWKWRSTDNLLLIIR